MAPRDDEKDTPWGGMKGRLAKRVSSAERVVVRVANAVKNTRSRVLSARSVRASKSAERQGSYNHRHGIRKPKRAPEPVSSSSTSSSVSESAQEMQLRAETSHVHHMSVLREQQVKWLCIKVSTGNQRVNRRFSGSDMKPYTTSHF